MDPKNKALLVGGVVLAMTALATLYREVEPGNIAAVWLIFLFCSWNFFAYGFDRGMWPRNFVALDGTGKGLPFAREVMFWLTAVVYLLFLATFTFSK